MISVEEAERAWKTKEPVEYHHPMAVKPVVCTVAGFEVFKRIRRVSRIVLLQPPGNSFIRTRPEFVTVPHRRSPELEKALALLDEIEEVQDDESL